MFEFLPLNISNRLADKLKFPLDPLFKNIQKSLIRLTSRISKKENIELELDDLDYKIDRINLKKDEVEVLIRVKGKSDLGIHVI